MKNAKQESTGKIRRDGKSAEAVPPLLHREVFAVNSKSINTECVMCPNCSKSDTVLAWILSNTPAEREVDQVNGS